MKKMLVAAASLIVGLMFCVSAASAGPSTSSLQLVVLGQASVAGAAPSNQASFGSQVTFNVHTTAQQPYVSVACSQGRLGVYGQWWGFWDGFAPSVTTNAMAVGGVFTLGPNVVWSSGSATCTATLSTFKNGRQTNLATLPFAVAA